MLDTTILAQAAKRAALKKSNQPQKNFVKQYMLDPVAFTHDCFTWRDNQGPTFYQDEILSQIPVQKRVSFRGPRGLGKSSSMAWIALWYSITRELHCQIEGTDWKVSSTAGAWRQLVKFLWPEIHKWSRRLDWQKIPLDPFDRRTQLLTQSLKLAHGEAFAMASDVSDLTEGAHADYMLCMFDESKAISHQSFDSAEGMSNGSVEAFFVAASTPGDRSGRFYDIQRRAPGFENWWVRHVTIDECIKAGRVPKEWQEQLLRQWGYESPLYQSQVLGNFPEQTENSLINLTWVEKARQQEFEPIGPKLAGCDIARYGDDDSVELVSQDARIVTNGVDEIYTGACIMSIERWQGHDLMSTAGRIIHNGIPAQVDTIGVGAGVYDRLRELNFDATPINVGESAVDSEHFMNLRAELYWKLRDDFRDGKLDLSRLDQDDYNRLLGELTAILYEFDSKGRIKIEAKDDIKKRMNGSSPDYADALMLTRSVNNGLIGIRVL